MNLPDNISHLLGVDFSGNVVSLDASIFSSTTINQTNINVSDSRIPTANEATSASASTITNNIIKQTIENGFVIEADSYFVPLVNGDGKNFINSSIYQSDVRVGINTRTPQYLLDVFGGSVNISTTDDVTTYGFKIDGYNIAYKDIANNLIYFGNDLDLKIASINTLLLRGLIPTTPLGEDRYLTVSDLGIVSATDEVNASRIRVKVRNSTGSTIYKGMIVYLSGSTGNRPNISLARANAESTSARTFGATYTDIPNNSDGYVVVMGNIQTLDTRTNAPNPFTLDTLVEGDQLYLSPTNAGYVTNIKPSAPNHMVYVGKVIRLSPTNGMIEYQITNGFELDELHDVKITSKSNKDFIYYDGTSGLWKNAQFDTIMIIGGEVSGTYSNIILSEAAILAKKLTGLNTSSGGSIVAADTLISAFGKLQSQLNSLQGSLIFKGTWNASTNTPTIVSGVGTKGDYYVVSIAGATNIDGNNDWNAKDWIVFNGTTWDKIDNTDSVISVNGFNGIVNLTTSNIPEAATPVNKYFTDARAVASMTGAISSVTTSNLAIGRALISDGSGKISVSLVTSTELGYISGVTSSIQTQLNGKQPTLTNPITGTGTTNYLPKFTGSTTLGNSLIYDDGTNIGIKNISPSATLSVTGTGLFSSTLTIGASRPIVLDGSLGSITMKGSAGGWVIGTFFQGSAGTSYGGFGAFGGTDAFTYYFIGDSHTSNGIRVYPTTNNILMSGNVGIGTTTTTYKLNWQSGTNFGFLDLAVGGATIGSTGFFEIYTGATPTRRVRVNTGGNVSIGNTNNTYKLEVTGTGYFSSTLNANSFVKIGGTSTQYLMADGNVSTLTDSLVTSKLLTGYTTLTGTVSSTDTILQAFGRVQAQLNALSGSLIYKGPWNASTNSPTIVSGIGTNGNYYIVSVAGTTTIDGISSWSVGDWIIFNGTAWQKISNQSVTSINGLTGVVTITTSNIAEGSNLYYTNARAIASTISGYVSGAGTITSADTILSSIQKLNGNIGALVTGVSSVFGRTGAVVAVSGDYTTTLVTEGTNLYYTQARFDTAFTAKSTTNLSEGTNLYFTTARAREAIATPSAPLSYNSTTGIFSISQATTTTDGYLSSANWNTFNNKQSALTFGNLTESTSSILTITNGTGSVIGVGTTIQVKQASSTQSGFLTSSDWTTFNNKVPSTRILTINGISYDLSADRTWSITTGTVGGSGVTNYVAKWISSTSLGTGAIYDTGTNVSIGNIPTTSYRFNVANVSGTRFLSIWQPTIDGAEEVGILTHKGGGLFDQAPFLVNASRLIFLIGITTRIDITSSSVLIATTGVTGGGALQVAGNVNITGNFQVNGVTIGSGGGGVSYLYQLSDVTISSPTNGQALVYNSSTSKWVNSTISSGGGAVSSVFGRTGSITAVDGDYTLNLLGDVIITSPSNGQLLQFNGSNWVNATVSTSGGVNNLYQLLDVNIVSVANDQVLSYNSSTGKWQNKAFTAAPVSSVFGRTGAITATDGDYTLNLLGDVTISSPSNGQVLQYNGSQWVNSSVSTSGVGGSGVANYLSKWSNTTTLTNSSIQDSGVAVTSSVSITAPAFYESSDLRLKNLLSLDCVEDLSSLVPISYTFKSDSENRIRFGYSAQQVRKLMKELCYDDINGYLSISYTDIHTLKIKQLEDRVEELEKQLKLR